jgi:hypothetical protein
MAQSLAYRLHVKMVTRGRRQRTDDRGQKTVPLSVVCRPSSEVRLLRFVCCLLSVWISTASAAGSYDLAFSTYFGGGQWEHARDVCADAQGYVYVCGGTASHDFPTPGPTGR